MLQSPCLPHVPVESLSYHLLCIHLCPIVNPSDSSLYCLHRNQKWFLHMVPTVVHRSHSVARKRHQNLRVALSTVVPSLDQLCTLLFSLTSVSYPFLPGLRRYWYVFVSWVGPAGLDVLFPYDLWVYQLIWKADCKMDRHPVLSKNSLNKIEDQIIWKILFELVHQNQGKIPSRKHSYQEVFSCPIYQFLDTSLLVSKISRWIVTRIERTQQIAWLHLASDLVHNAVGWD